MAGEIQLNSTTMATESSGSITAQLDTIRPNTTNGSLTLQGDSSDAGVTGLTIDSSGNATFAQTISGGTIGSNVVFPAGKLINYDLQIITTSVTATTSNDTPNIAGSTGISVTLPAGSSALISASGGKLYGAGGTTRRDSTALISYTTDGTTPSSSSNIVYGGNITVVSPAGTAYVPGIVEGKVDNATGSDVTLKWNWGVKGNTTPLTGQWQSAIDNYIFLKTLIFKN